MAFCCWNRTNRCFPSTPKLVDSMETLLYISLSFWIMQNEEANDNLAYWLSNTSTLLYLLQRSLKAASAAGPLPPRKLPPSTSFFGRMAQVCNYLFFRYLHIFPWKIIYLLYPAKIELLFMSFKKLICYISAIVLEMAFSKKCLIWNSVPPL